VVLAGWTIEARARSTLLAKPLDASSVRSFGVAIRADNVALRDLGSHHGLTRAELGDGYGQSSANLG
jgi:hypothetical protein